MRQRVIYGIIIVLVVAVLGTVALLARQNQQSPVSQKKVAVTIFGIHDAVARVAGDAVQVVQVLPAGQSPHTFDPSPALISELSGTTATFKVGLGFDDWIDPIARNASGATQLIELNKGVPLICEEENGVTPQDAEEEEAGCNPHIWLSPKNMQTIVTTVTEKLSKLFPEDAATFEVHAAAYQNELNMLDQEISQKLSEVNSKSFVTFHDAFSYFARDYNLKIAATIEPFPGKEPTAAYLADVSKTIKRLGIKTIFREPELSDAVVQSLAQDLGLSIGTLDSAEATVGNVTYSDVMKKNTETIANALK